MLLALVGLFVVALVLCSGLLALTVQSARAQLRDQEPSGEARDVSPSSSDEAS
jgi:hypothetical protein